MTSRNNSAGFTLIEMIVVIAVLGLVIAMLVQYGPLKDRWAATQGAAATVAAAMEQARGRAISSGAPVTVALPALPDWLGVAVSAPPGGIVFEPDGSATAARVVLDDGGRRITVATDWLTGRVSVDAP